MTLEQLGAVILVALISTITPGPNNLMLMASGANFGFRRTVPHMLGISLGFPLMIALVGLGVMQLFDLWPPLHTILKVLSVAYLLYLAWKIANAGKPRETRKKPRPLTFVEAAGFQWVNPKAWSIALSVITLYAAGRTISSVLIVAAVFVIAGAISTTSWTVLGQQMRRFLGSPLRLRIFNWTMAVLLLATLIPVLWPKGI